MLTSPPLWPLLHPARPAWLGYLQDPLQSQFLVADKVTAYLSFGGVRLEDNVLVTAHGIDNLTDVPRSVAEVEAVMAGAPWPPA